MDEVQNQTNMKSQENRYYQHQKIDITNDDQPTILQSSRQKSQQTQKIKTNSSNKFEQLENILKIYISVDIIQTIENNNTRNCSYLLFHCGFLYLLCDVLQHTQNRAQSYLINILKQQLKIINSLNSKQPRQLPIQEIMKCLVDGLNFNKKQKGYYLKELSLYLQRHKGKMSTFMPYYYYLFELISKRNQYIKKETTIEDMKIIKQEKVNWIRAKFHNFDLQ